jgi:hypothetical protein
MSPFTTNVGTSGYVASALATGDEAVGFSHQRHCFKLLNAKLVEAAFENGAK